MIAYEYSINTRRKIKSKLRFFLQYQIKIDRLAKIVILNIVTALQSM